MAEEKKLIIEKDGKEYDITGSGKPEKDSVGTEEIKDDSVMLEDLNEEVKDELGAEIDDASEEEVDDWFND